MPTWILRLPDGKVGTSLSRSTIYGQISKGDFTKPVSLGLRSVGWVESEIKDWLQSRIREIQGADG